MFGKKVLKAYVLVEKTNFENMRHVSVLLETPLGDKSDSIDLELDDRDIEGVEKIVNQLNESRLGKTIQIFIRSK